MIYFPVICYALLSLSESSTTVININFKWPIITMMGKLV